MSQLLGGADAYEVTVCPNDMRGLANHYRQVNVELQPVGELPDYRSPWWPGTGNATAGDAGDVNPIASYWYEQPDTTRGSAYIFGFTGVTRDVYGSPVSGVTVKLYLTNAVGNQPADQAIFTAVSDANGNYAVYSSFGGAQHYLVMYKAAGALPYDTFATTSNQLLGV